MTQCPNCETQIHADEVMCDTCANEFHRQSSPTIWQDGTKLDPASRTYTKALEAIWTVTRKEQK